MMVWEILHRQMAEETTHLNMLKRTAFRHGLDLIMLDTSDFVSPEPAERQKAIDHTISCIGLAVQMGIPCIRP
ncbi:MAG: hypothetical protein WKF84_08580 [Pyrinomonadaceae bacterium]